MNNDNTFTIFSIDEDENPKDHDLQKGFAPYKRIHLQSFHLVG